MGSDLTSSLRPTLMMTLLFALLLGLAYPAALTGVAQLVAPGAANGSLLRNDRGTVIGSSLIGQAFASDRYFHGRPSAAGKNGYDATASSGSNYGPTSKPLVDRIKGDLAAAYKSAPGAAVPGDLVTASGSGLDPDISPDAARFQAARVASARGIAPARVNALITANTDHPLLGFLGEPRVNVLALNRALDREAPHP